MQTSPPNDETPATANNETALAEGTKIGGCYVLRRNLSKSDTSPVWVATDEVLGKDVTLHFVPGPVAGNARAMAELRQEVKRNRQLIHPNILRVYDFVEDGSLAAISMDEFEGESLDDVLKRKGRLDTADIKPWISQLAETLADAHRIQLFHRDLAPSNLYLRPNGGLLVANFGVSRVILNTLERAGIAKGADAHLPFLSPQQIDGERPGASDDIYGFGVLMYTLLAGVPPFTGDDMVMQIRKTVPAPISEVCAAAGATAPVPASWEKLISSCLEKNAEARPRSLTEVLTLLGQDSGPARSRTEAAPVVEKPAASEPQQIPAEVEEILKASAVSDAAASSAESEKPAISQSAAEKPAVTETSAPSGSHHPEIPPIPPERKAPAKASLSANYTDLERPRSKAPLVWLAAAASIIGVGIYMKNKSDSGEGDANGSVTKVDDNTPPASTPEPKTKGKTKGTEPASKPPGDLPDPQPVDSPKIVSNPQTVGNVEPPKAETPKPAGTPAAATPKSGSLIGSEPPVPATSAPANVATTTPKPGGTPTQNVAVKPPATPAAATPAPAPATPTPAVAKNEPLPTLPEPVEPLAKIVVDKLTKAQLDEAKTQREAAVQNIRAAATAADVAHQEATRRIDTAKAEKDKLQKGLEAMKKLYGPVILQSDQIEADRKKFETEAEKTAIAAAEAKKQAEAAKQKLDDAIAKGGDKLKERQKAEAELSTASSLLAGVSKNLDALSQVQTKAETIRMQARLSQQQAEQDLQKITAAREKIRLDEVKAMRKANAEKITVIEKDMAALNGQIARHDTMIEQLKELGDAGKEAIKKLQEKKADAQQQISDKQAEIARLSGTGPELPVKKETTTSTTKPAATPPVTPPEPTPAVKPPIPAPAAETSAPVNSLGIRFVPVGDVQFAVYLTTVKDFESFATATGLKSEAWKNPGFKQGPDHPVVNVTWREADAFCKWLTEKERKAGLLKPGELYRLPTDLEWSKAVGLPSENGANPEERDMGVQDVYPWGNAWPPPAGAGNYAGEETSTDIPIPGYNDGFPNTSPVGKFKVNAAGLYDMGGNVWQWVNDFWNGENRAKTLRGGSWYNGAIPLSLLSSCRISSSPDTLHDTYGFRIVKASETAKPRKH